MSSDIYDLTIDEHKAAEKSAFNQALLYDGFKDNPQPYCDYLMHLKSLFDRFELLMDIPDNLKRSSAIALDIHELTVEYGCKLRHKSINWHHYLEYLGNLYNFKDFTDRLYSHAYVSYLGVLYGGQMISKKVPGKGRMYKFNSKHRDLIDHVRQYPLEVSEVKMAYRVYARLHEFLAEENKIS